MPGLGTLVNVIAVIVAGVIGCTLHGGLKKRFQDILMHALGLSTLFIGVAGALRGLLTLTEGKLETDGAMTLIGSLVIGSFVGEWINIEKHIESFGEWLKKKAGSERDMRFTDGFVSATLVICVGAMAVVGSLQDGISRDSSMLFTKSVLDFVIILVMASTLGKGVIFSAIPLGIFQGIITLFAGGIEPLLSENSIRTLAFVGSVLIFCVGVNITFGKKFKVGNMLPSLIPAVIFGLCGF